MAETNPGTTNLVSWWKLDEESGARADSHGTNNLTDNNTVLFSAGKISNAAQYVNANTEFLSHVHDASLSPGDVDFHFVTWVYFDNLTTNQIVISKWTINKYEYILVYRFSEDYFRVQISNDGLASTNVNATTFGGLAIDTWYMVDFYHDAGNNLIGVRVNDGVKDTAAHATGVHQGNTDFQLGSGLAGAGGMDGRQDETLFRSGSLFSDNEIEWLYNSGAGRRYEALRLDVNDINTVSLNNAKTINTINVDDIKTLQGI